MVLSLADITPVLLALGQPDWTSLQLLDAATVADQHYPQFDPAQPALLLRLADTVTAQRLVAVLLQAYPPAHPITLLQDDQRRGASLSQIAQIADLTADTHLYLPPRAGAATYEALQDVVAQLRAPDGCPWDRALTWAKLRASLLEESYELLAALDADDPAKVAEEQGDLLLQVALQAQIATEDGRYRLPDVIARIVEKLIRRHPHVFGDAVVSNEAEVLANWEAIKATERARNGEKRSPLAGVPAGLPALAQAEAYLDRMSRLRSADAPEAPWAPLAALDPDVPLDAETLGNALFGLVAWSLARGVEAESALRQANARFASGIEEARPE